MKTFCVVDDDEIFKMLLKKVLGTIRYSNPILDFNDGEEALRHFTKLAGPEDLPEVIFIDIKMYGMSGWDFLPKFQNIKTKLNKEIDIYVVSNSSLSKDQEKAKNVHQATGYIVKPISPETLSAILQ